MRRGAKQISTRKKNNVQEKRKNWTTKLLFYSAV